MCEYRRLQLFAPMRSRRAGRISADRFHTVRNYFPAPGQPAPAILPCRTHKPLGGVWTSTYTPDAATESDWVRFCQLEHPDWIPAFGYLYRPVAGVRLYAIDL